MTAKEYLRANEYVPNEFGTYVYQNKQGVQHSVNLEAILEDYASEKFNSLQRELEAEKGANIDEIEMLRGISEKETASLRKELEEAKFSLMEQDRKIILLEEGLSEERAKSAKMVEALKDKGWDIEDSGFGDGTCTVTCNNVFDTKEDAQGFVRVLAEYEGKGGSIETK